MNGRPSLRRVCANMMYDMMGDGSDCTNTALFLYVLHACHYDAGRMLSIGRLTVSIPQGGRSFR